MRFRDTERAETAMERLASLTGVPFSSGLREAVLQSPDPDLALTHMEGWLAATSNPATHLGLLADLPTYAKRLLLVFGASDWLSSALVQNPELAAVLSEPTLAPHSRESLLHEGRQLLAASLSVSHALDRLRFLKQSKALIITVADLAEEWSPPTVWLALSELADALIELALEATWKEFNQGAELPEPCPLAVVAFGKLGGREVNYSSDIDLVYVCPDGLGEFVEHRLARFAERLTASLGDRMGRGALYRVDLRLRPHGRDGVLTPSMRSCEAYYRNYAEVWEYQALLRSRVVVGPTETEQRWEALRHATCFRHAWSEAAVDDMIAMRSRIEERARTNDIKRGSGGIRDIEFLCQVLQMLHGSSHPDLQTKPTLEVLDALEALSILNPKDVQALTSAYVFLRTLEHRIQEIAESQTHDVPENPDLQSRLAIMMKREAWRDVEIELEEVRQKVRDIFNRHMHSSGESLPIREHNLRLSSDSRRIVSTWFDGLPHSSFFYEALESNKDSLDRVRKIVEEGPILSPYFQRSVGLTEALLSGEIEEHFEFESRLQAAPLEPSLVPFAKAIRSAWLTTAAQWLLGPTFEIGGPISDLIEAALRHIFSHQKERLDVVALGSFANREMGLFSDADLVLLVEDRASQQAAEDVAEMVLDSIQALRVNEAPIAVDLRLRPEGRKGLLVSTYEGLRNYASNSMEMWERFALGSARTIFGNPTAAELLREEAYARPVTPERFEELMVMKQRIENERVPVKYRQRHVKLGHGGLGDIEWFVHLHEMRYPTATDAFDPAGTVERLRRLSRAHLINAFELEELLAARAHLLTVRTRLALLGQENDIVPENPDKLDRLAHTMGFAGGNDFLAYHERVIDAVRAIYHEGLDRLQK